MANVPKAITDLPVASAMGDDDLLVVSQNATTSSIKGELIKGYAQNAVASQVTAAQTAANQAGQSATQAEAARQGAAAAQTAAENAQDAAETARDQSVAAAGTIGDSVEQAQTAAGQASSAKDAAVAAQTAAETAKTAAETSSGQAQTAATQAAGSATAAQTAATQAGDAKTGAETARNEAETSASSAANSASDAESAATEAEQAKTYIENMDMEGETLPAGSSVTVTKTTSPEGNLLFVIGVPQGIQGDKGDPGETGATGPQGVSVTNATVNEDGDLVITLSSGSPINAGSVIGPRGIQGEVGPTGASVDRIERTSGTGAPGTTDTYTVYLTDGQTGGTFQVYNGSNGTGSGDFMADGSVPMTGDLQMGGHAVTGMADGTDPTDGATVGQLAGKLDSPDGGTAGQVLTKTADGSAWEDAPSGLPEGGTEGQVLKRGASGPEWGDKPVMYVNITDSGGTYSADKTFAEIESAIESEYSVVANVKEENEELETGFILPLAHFVSGSVVMFSLYLDGSYYFASVAANNFASYSEVKIKAISISFTPTSTLTSENVQDAIDEVQGNVENVLPSGGTTGQVLTKTSTGEEWSDAPSGLPEGGTEGQMLYKSLDGTEWGDKPNIYVNINYSDGSYSADKTYEEIRQLLLDGFHVFAQYGGRIYVLSGCLLESSITSIKFFNAVYVSYRALNGSFLVINPDSSVSINSFQLDFNDYVPVTRSINGNRLNQDVHLSAEDVNAIENPENGTEGQILEKTSSGAAWVDKPESGITQEQADERYLRLSGGTMTGAIMASFGQDFGIHFVEKSNSITIGSGGPVFSVSGTNDVEVNNSSGLTLNGNGGTTSISAQDKNDVLITGRYLFFGEDTSAVGRYDYKVLTEGDYKEQFAPTSVAVTLTSSSWSSNTQTVTVSGVSATETAQLITPTPAIASQSAYYEAGIMCTGQAANSLTFTCQTVPTSNLTVYVVIQPLS